MSELRSWSFQSLLESLSEVCLFHRILGRVTALVLMLIAISVYSQAVKQEAPQSESYSLRMDPSQRHFRRGGPYVFEIALVNETNEEMYFVTGHRMEDFWLEVRDQENHVVSISNEAQARKELPITGSYQTIRLNPGETRTFELDLRYSYDLAPGKYSLFISMPVYGKDKVTVRRASLKPVKISIR